MQEGKIEDTCHKKARKQKERWRVDGGDWDGSEVNRILVKKTTHIHEHGTEIILECTLFTRRWRSTGRNNSYTFVHGHTIPIWWSYRCFWTQPTDSINFIQYTTGSCAPDARTEMDPSYRDLRLTDTILIDSK